MIRFVIPAYNEAPNVERLMEQLRPVARSLGARVIIVDDGSTDGTAGILAGLAAANTVAAQAYLADRTENKEERVAAMGRVGATLTAGLLFGPALGGWLSGIGGNLLLGLVAASASGIGALWIAVTLAPVPPKIATDTVSPTPTSPEVGLSLLRDVPRLRSLLVLASVAFLALACLEGTFGRLIRHRLGLGPLEFGLIFGYESLVSVLIQSAGIAWVASRLSPGRILGIGFLLQGVGLALTPFAPNLAALFAVSTPYAIGTALATPTLNSLCSGVTPPERQGEMFGLLQGARSAGFLVGPTVGGLLFDWRPEAPYLAAGVILVLAAISVTAISRSGLYSDSE